MTDFQKTFGKDWITTILATFGDLTDALGELDRQAGDGEFGTNFAPALTLTQQNVETLDNDAVYRDWLTALFRGFLGVGGTSGPLFGMYFRELAHRTESIAPAAEEWAAGLEAGVKKVQYNGNAEVGQKTMVDAMGPAAEAAQQASRGGDIAATVQAALDAATEGALSTADILAKRGRASYVGEAARGVIDPGAVTVAVVLQCALDAVNGAEPTGLPEKPLD